MRIRSQLLLLCVALACITCKDTTTIYEPVSLTDPGVIPSVIYTFPGNNSAGPYDGFSTTLTVRFNKLMDYPSLHRSIHWSSALGDIRPDTSVLSNNQGDVATIRCIPSDFTIPFRFRIGEAYTLTIDTTARDVNGNALRTPFHLTFKSEPYFRVKSINPASGAVNVRSSSIQIAFNAPVDSSILSTIVISPATPGLWHYQGFTADVSDSSLLLFVAERPLKLGLTYTLTIPSGAVDREGHPLSAGFISSFSMQPFAVARVYPSDGTTGWDTGNRYVQVSCNDTIDTSSVRRAFKLSPAMPGNIEFSGDRMSFRFRATTDLLASTVYSVTVDTSMRSASGRRLSHAFISEFSTGDPRNLINGTSPADGDTTVPLLIDVIVYFHTQVDTASARRAFAIAPPVPGLLSFSSDYSWMRFSPIRSFVPQTVYTISLDTSLASLNGAHLASPYTITFKTLAFKVTGTTPSDGETQYPRSSGINVQMSDFIDPSTIPSGFHISPPVDGAFSYPTEHAAYFYFYPASPLQPYTIYTVTITDSLKSSSGYPAPAATTFSFSTGP